MGISLIFLVSFSIFTDSAGRYRKYRLVDLPFNYHIHSSTPEAWIPSIQRGADAWNNIAGCYFEFSYDGLTEASTFSADGINLVYFDSNFDNFDSSSNVIAFSGTFTEGVGTSNFRAVESDLIWNAAAFPPAINEGTLNPSRQDLQSIISHEFGHHLGLGHTGPAGQPIGVGELITNATMYGLSSNGDTTGRSLHIDDIMGAVSIYPRWTLDISLFDSLVPIDNYLIILPDNFSAIYDDPLLVGSTYQKAGYVKDTLFAGNSGGVFRLSSLADTFDIKLRKFGYQDYDTTIGFDPSVPTPVISNIDIQLKESEKNNIILNFLNDQGVSVNSIFRLFSYSDEEDTYYYQDTIQNNAAVHFRLPTDVYDLQIEPDFPYAFKTFNALNINNDTTINIILDNASLLLIDDDYDGSEAGSRREVFYIDRLTNKLARNLAYLNLNNSLGKFTYNNIAHFRDVIWFTGNNLNPAFSENKLLLDTLAVNNYNILFTGNKIASAISADGELQSFFGIDSAGQAPIQLLQGTPGDFIGQGEFHGVSVAHPEMMRINGVNTEPVMNFLGSDYYGALKHQSGYKWVMFSFALEDSSSGYSSSRYLTRVLDWFDDQTVSIDKRDMQPNHTNLFQNYPNPFNPLTTIRYHLADAVKVKLSVYDVSGRLVTILVNEKQQAGDYLIRFKPNNISSGIYYYHLQGKNFSFVRPMVFLK